MEEPQWSRDDGASPAMDYMKNSQQEHNGKGS